MTRSKSQKFNQDKLNGHSKLKKDPGVPKLPSLKAKHALQVKVSHAGGPGKQDDSAMAAEPTLASLAFEAQKQEHELLQAGSSHDEDVSAARRRQYVRTLHRVVESADVILLVLDARDPPGSRSRLVEDEVRRRDKKLVFILNKIDLVPRQNAEAWLAYLRHEAPTLPFRASTQTQRTNLTTRTAPALLHLLKSFKKGPASSITAGVVGAPNVGKSSLINSLKRARVCATAAEPGCTTDVQTISLERGVKIVDSPGVVFDDHTGNNAALLRNVISVDEVADPVVVVETIVARSDATTLQKLYNLPAFSTPLEFLTMLALTTGRLGRGGVPDTAGAARVVLRDWNRSKIPFFTDVPKTHASDIGSEGAIVAQFAPAFDLGALYASNDAAAFMDIETGDDEEAMEEDGAFIPDANDMTDDAGPSTSFTSASRKRKRADSDDEFEDSLPFPHGPPSDDLDSPMTEHPPPSSTVAGSERPAKRQRLEKIKKPRKQAPPPSLALASAGAVQDAEAIGAGVSRKMQRTARKKAAKAARKHGEQDMTVDDDAADAMVDGPAPPPPLAVGAFSFAVPMAGLGEVMI